LRPATNHIYRLAYWCFGISSCFVSPAGKGSGNNEPPASRRCFLFGDTVEERLVLRLCRRTFLSCDHMFLPLQQIPTIKYRIHPIPTG